MSLVAALRQTLSRALLESGAALERVSMAMVGDYSFNDPVSQHRTFIGLPSEGNPTADATAEIYESATLVGKVHVGAKAHIGPGAVVNGPTLVGDGAKVGSGAVIKGGVTVEPGATVAEGAVVLKGTTVPSGEYWAGAPAEFVKKL